MIRTRTAASRPEVWRVLADGRGYADWVVGATRIRAVEGAWPQTGSRLLHTVGDGPGAIDDETVVVECAPGRRLALRARVGPLGEAHVVLELADLPGGGCEVRMTEDLTRGPGLLTPGPVRRFALDVRNVEVLRRLVRIAEGRRSGSENADAT